MIAPPESLVRFPDELEDLLLRFEEAWNSGIPADPRAFCPPKPDSNFLLELVRIDISRRRHSGKTLPVNEYLAQFPELSGDAKARKTLEAILETLPPSLDPNASTRAVQREIGLADSATPDSITVSATYSDILEHARGGLGEVFVAEDARLHRRVALKLLQQRWLDSSRAQQFFRQEVEITSRLQHPGIVPVHAVGQTADGRPCYSMKFVEGETLREAIRRYHESPSDDLAQHSLRFRELLTRFVAVCNTVAYAHSREVLHRDLKPENIMLGPFGETLVLDWGLAKQMGETNEGADPFLDSPEEDGTQAGEVLGTPAYMSPEQASGDLEHIGPATDIFGLGATLYAILTGVAPYQEASKVIMLAKARVGDFVPPRQSSPMVPAPLDAICRKAMAVESDRRYSSALDLARDVENWLADERVQAWQEPWHLRSRRYLRNRRTLVSVLGVLGLILPVAFGVGSWLVANERAKRKIDRETAEIKERSATEMSEYLVKTFETADPLGLDSEGFHGAGERSQIAGSRRMLDSGAELMRDHMRNQPVRRASLLDAIGNSYRSLGEWDKARIFLQEGFELRFNHLGAGTIETLASMHSLARLAQDRGEYSEAAKIYQEVISGREALNPPQPLLLARTKAYFAWMYMNQPYSIERQHDSAESQREAERLLQEALSAMEKHLPPNNREIGFTLAALSAVKTIQGKDVPAKMFGARALEVFRQSSNDDSIGNLLIDYRKAEDYRYQSPPRNEDAEKIYLRILDYCRKHLGPKHPQTILHMANICGLYVRWNNKPKLLAMAGSLMELLRDSPSLRSQQAIVDGMTQYGDLLKESSSEKAIAIYIESLKYARERPKINERSIQVLESRLKQSKEVGSKK